MHNSLLLFHYTIAPRSIGNNIAIVLFNIAVSIVILGKMSIGIGIANTFIG